MNPEAKRCSVCRENKALDDYHRRTAVVDGRASACRSCKKEIDAHVYNTSRTTIIRRKKKRRAEQRDWYISLKKDKPCTDCNQTYHHAAMHWDHLPGTVKLFNLAEACSNFYSNEKVLAEIAKCELVCANCHSIRTFKRLQR